MVRKLLLFGAVFTILFSSCVPQKKLKYVQEDEYTKDVNQFKNVRLEKTIQSWDKVFIRVYSLDQKTATLFNSYQSSSGVNSDMQLNSYTVDDSGYINFPFIGQIYIKDLTINAAQEKIQKSLNEYLSNVSVNVRYVGNTITLLGEVRNPGEFSFIDEKITIFEGIGLAGGVADYGNKQNITLIREQDNIISYQTLDLSNKGITKSEYYYLQPNDVIIVHPVKAKYRILRDYGTATTILSGILTIVTIWSLVQNL